jgi:hypothetical protein
VEVAALVTTAVAAALVDCCTQVKQSCPDLRFRLSLVVAALDQLLLTYKGLTELLQRYRSMEYRPSQL